MSLKEHKEQSPQHQQQVLKAQQQREQKQREQKQKEELEQQQIQQDSRPKIHHTKEAIKAELAEYARINVEPVLSSMMQQLLLHVPEEPVQFMIDFLINYQEQSQIKEANLGMAEETSVPPPTHLIPLPIIETATSPRDLDHTNRPRRAGISAEPMAVLDDAQTPNVVIPKSDKDCTSILSALQHNILFASLMHDEMKVVVDAMEPREHKAGTVIIRQGDDGHHFFVVGVGDCECFVASSGQTRKVMTYAHGDTFGELALMYNNPRAATIVARTDVTLWAVDRVTFRKVLMNSTQTKRKQYEQFLQRVPLLVSLTQYERAKIADALQEVEFADGECIIAQGDPGNHLYLIREGQAKAVKILSGGTEPMEVMRYQPGDYFGELALLNDHPRAASVFAVGATQCVTLNRAAFDRLLGPCADIMKRNMNNYQQAETKLQASRARRVMMQRQQQLQQQQQQQQQTSPSEQHDDMIHMDNEEDEDGRGEEKKGDFKTDTSFADKYALKGRRKGICAEPVTELLHAEVKRPVIPKSTEQCANIRRALSHNFLFTSLDQEQLQQAIDAMFEREYRAGENIIVQGEDGDNFYVVDVGVCDCWVKKGNAKPVLMRTFVHGESFGELALMYNCPRTATITARTDVRVWGMDRVTFRLMIMQTTERKRKTYESFLQRVPLLSMLTNYERHTIADALQSKVFENGQAIIKRGEIGDRFYIVEEGEAKATKKLSEDEPETEVYRYTPGSYFGELALLRDQPRAANVFAVGKCKCVFLDRGSFERLLGPCQDLLERNSQMYQDIESRLKSLGGADPRRT